MIRHPLAALHAQGILVLFEGGEITLKAQGGVLSPEVLALARKGKTQIIECLAGVAESFGVRALISGPLSREQQRLFFVQKQNEVATEQGISLALRFNQASTLAPGAVQQAAQQHPMLQSVIIEQPEPYLVWITAGLACPERVADLRYLSAPDLEAVVRDIIRQDVQRPFALDTEPGVRALRILEPSGAQVLHLMRQHLYSDGWSLGLILNSIHKASIDLAQGRPLSTVPQNSIYLQHACRQQQCPSPPVLERGDINIDGGRFWAAITKRGRARIHRLSLAGGSLDRLCKKAGVSQFVAAASKFSVLLSVMFSRRLVLLGVDLTTRATPGDESCVGTYVNRGPLTINVPSTGCLSELLGTVQRDVNALVGQSDRPFEDLAQTMQKTEGNPYDPVFDILFGLHPEPRHAPYRHLENVTVLDSPDETTHAPLSVYLTVAGSDLYLEIRYDEQCLSAVQVRGLVNAYVSLLDVDTTDIGELRRICISALGLKPAKAAFRDAASYKARVNG